MKKLLAILLAAVMLLSACALGEGAQIALRNIVLTEDGEAIADLSGFDAVLAFAMEGDIGGLGLHFDLNGTELAGAVLAMVGQQVLLEINSGSAVSAYYLDLTELLGVLGAQINMQTLLESFTFTLGSEDMDLGDFGTQMEAILGECIADGGVTEISGEEYNVLLVDIEPEQMQALIEWAMQMAVESGSSSIEEVEEVMEALKEAQVEIGINGAVFTNDISCIIDLATRIDSPELDNPVIVTAYIDGGADALGNYLTSVDLRAINDDESFGLSLDIGFEANIDTSWLPLSVDGAVNILSVEDLESELMGQLNNVASAVAMGVMIAMQMNTAA